MIEAALQHTAPQTREIDEIELLLARISSIGFDPARALEIAVLPANATVAVRQKFFRAALIADWACYTKPADRVDAPRLARLIDTFPAGFRVFFMTLEDGTKLPVGYTGWYPLARDVFYRMHDAPQALKSRAEAMPLPALLPGNNYLYAYNYSVIDALQKSRHSGVMLRAMARDMRAVPCGGLAAICVSENGVRVATRFGMAYRGDMTHDGEVEGVYTLQLEERL